jgi:hypothetical protein
MIWLIIYIAIVIFNAGAFYGHLKRGHRIGSREDLAYAWGFALLGPLSLPSAIFGTGFLRHGWRLK